MDTKILLVLGILVIFVASAYVIFELPKNKINEYGNLSFNKNNSDNQNTSLPMETKECSEYKKQECPEQNLTCPECVCPEQEYSEVECPEVVCPKAAGNVTVTTEVRSSGNANFNSGEVKFSAGSKKQTSGVNSTFVWNSSQSNKASLLFDLNYSCPECPKCKSMSCSCSCPQCICPECPESEKPDLTIANVSLNQDSINAGDALNITMVIKNSKNVFAGYVKVLLEIDNFTNQRFVYLGANSTENVSFEWIAKEGNYTLTVKVDPNNLINETNDSNNNYTTNITVLPEVCDPYNFTEVWKSGDLIDGIVNGVATGDLDGDGKDEIVAVTTEFYHDGWYGKNAIYVFESVDKDNYSLVWSSDVVGGRSVAIADIDCDSKFEIVVGNSKQVECKYYCGTKNFSGKDGLYVLERNGSSGYSIVWNYSVGVNSVAVEDVDKDCNKEIIVGGDNGIYVFKNNRSGYSLVWNNSSVGVNSVAVGDVDGDDWKEIVVGGDDGIYIFEKNRDGFLLVWSNMSIVSNTVVIGDFDGDNKYEIFADRYVSDYPYPVNYNYVVIEHNVGDYLIVHEENIASKTIIHTAFACDFDREYIQLLMGGAYFGVSEGTSISIFEIVSWNGTNYIKMFVRSPFIFAPPIKSMLQISKVEKGLKIVVGVDKKDKYKSSSLFVIKAMCKKGDYNCDCKIDNQDFVAFVDVYNKTSAPSWADFNNDNKIDKTDLYELIKRME